MRPSDLGYSPFYKAFTPWCRAAIRMAGIDPDELMARVPDGWRIGGSAKSANGPYSFSLVGPNHEIETVMPPRWPDVKASLDRLFAKVPA